MVINDEITKEINGHKDILAINIYRFNNLTVGIDEELNEDELVLKIAEEIKSRYSFFKVAQKDNKHADVFMSETIIANINEITIVDPIDLLPTETIQIQIEIAKTLEAEGFSELAEAEVVEFSGDSLTEDEILKLQEKPVEEAANDFIEEISDIIKIEK